MTESKIGPCEHCGEKMTAGRLCDRCRTIKVQPGPKIDRVLDEVDASELERARFERLADPEKILVAMAIRMGAPSVRKALQDIETVRTLRAEVGDD